MTSVTVGFLGLAILFSLIGFGMPIGFAMGLVGFAGFAFLVSFDAAIVRIGVTTFNLATNHAIGTIPLFLFMAHLLFASGIGRDLYDFAAKWLGRRRGGLAMATIGASSGFAAVSASSLATTATMGLVAMPEMRKHNYDVSLASGSVVAGGTIGALIPPSGMFIIYGILTETSIGAMFAAGIVPGILLALFYIVTIAIWCRLDPNAGPRGPKFTFMEKVRALRSTGEVIFLFGLVMGGIVLGWFTPTEAGAIGAFGAIIVSVARGRLNWATAKQAIYATLQTTGMIFGILFGALVFNSFITASTIPMHIVNFVTDGGFSPMVVLFLVLGVYLVLGMVLDASAMMTLTIPLFFPLITTIGFDAVLFGVLVVRMTEIALITPPVGMNVYILSGVAKDIPLDKIFKGALPFVAADVLHVGLLIAFPILVLWLPNL
ncbi:TRAP transporter large permease [Pelagibacterium limicola]|uniref:TRAP transporter large permease n=1 Tax=Pelagibacterium limicola TaxID=2791022 RepID=UPI0018AFDF22|nr:TRAP transporter large permease [Pelagibacterium limicola]